MGEFSVKNMKFSGGILRAVIAAGTLVAVPAALHFGIQGRYGESLAPNDAHVLSSFFFCAVIFGATVTATIYLYGCYPRGARSRLLFGLSSGALIIAYAFIVLVISGLTSSLSDHGIPLDSKYFAVMLAFGALPLMFGAGAEYCVSRSKWLESKGSTKAGAARAR